VADLVGILFGAYRRDTLALLLLKPEQGLHLREIARATRKHAGTLLRELNQLCEAGLLTRRRVGNQVRFQANTACPVYGELRGLLEKTTPGAGQAPVTTPPAVGPAPAKLHIPRGRLAALCRRYGIRKLSLFGSAARNALRPESDIDLLAEFDPGRRASVSEHASLKDELSAQLSALFAGRPVDLVSAEALADPARRKTIEPELKVLYEAPVSAADEADGNRTGGSP
jgi:predicted nucleotidyltransferase